MSGALALGDSMLDLGAQLRHRVGVERFCGAQKPCSKYFLTIALIQWQTSAPRRDVQMQAVFLPNLRIDRLSMLVGAGLLVITVMAWLIVLESPGMDSSSAMQDMASGMGQEDPSMASTPASDVRMRLGVTNQMDALPWGITAVAFLGGWLVMMSAMMLPSATPMVNLFARSARRRYPASRAVILIGLFVLAYILVWGSFGIAAFALNESVAAATNRWNSLVRAGPYVAGVLLIGAGLYQVSQLKGGCLAKCRSPLSFVMREWRDGFSGALRMGLRHGLYCVGCCVGLMVALLVAGIMSIGWMVSLAVLIFLEKITPWGTQVARLTAVMLVIAGVALLVHGARLPGMA